MSSSGEAEVPGATRADAVARSRLRAGLLAPITALQRTAHDPVLRRVQLAWAAVMTASWAVMVSVAVVAYAAGGSTAVALAVLARSVPGAVAGAAVGAVVDRFPRRRIMAWSAAGGAAASACAAAVDEVVVAVVVMATVVALATMAFRASQSAVMPELVRTPADLTAANVVSSAIESAGVFAGPALAGLLLALHGPSLSFGVATVFFGLAALLLVGPAGPRPASGAGPDGQRAGIRELLRLRSARLSLGLILVQTLVGGALVVLYAALAVDELGMGESGVGLLTSAFGLGGLLGSVALFALAGSSRLGLFSAIGLLLWAVPLLLLPLSGLAAVLVLLALVGAGNVLFDVTTVTLLQRAVPDRLLGRAFGALETVVVIGLGLGALAAPVLEGLVGAAGALAVLAVPLAVVALVALVPLRALDARLVAPLRQVALLRGLPAFALLPTPELERLALRLQRTEVADGEAVVRQGEPGRRWFLLDDGEVVCEVDGREVSRLGAGEAFGEIALLREGRRTATVTALGPCRLWFLDRGDFLAVLTSHGGVALVAADDVVRSHLLRAAPAGRRPADWTPHP